MRKALGDRMKHYELAGRVRLMNGAPLIVRVDGRAFHSLTRGMERPWDENFMHCMNEVAVSLVNEVDGAKLAYVQSDEVSLLVTDYDTVHTEPWFNYVKDKVLSITASISTLAFAQASQQVFGKILKAQFDSRAFNLPTDEVRNYFIWRQQDCRRNALQSLAQSMYSPRQLHGKKRADLEAMCVEGGRDFLSVPGHVALGRVALPRRGVLPETPNFLRKASGGNTPVVIRVRGQAFKSLLAYLKRPWEDSFVVGLRDLPVQVENQGEKSAMLRAGKETTIAVSEFDTLYLNTLTPWVKDQQLISTFAKALQSAYARAYPGTKLVEYCYALTVDEIILWDKNAATGPKQSNWKQLLIF